MNVESEQNTQPEAARVLFFRIASPDLAREGNPRMRTREEIQRMRTWNPVALIIR